MSYHEYLKEPIFNGTNQICNMQNNINDDFNKARNNQLLKSQKLKWNFLPLRINKKSICCGESLNLNFPINLDEFNSVRNKFSNQIPKNKYTIGLVQQMKSNQMTYNIYKSTNKNKKSSNNSNFFKGHQNLSLKPNSKILYPGQYRFEPLILRNDFFGFTERDKFFNHKTVLSDSLNNSITNKNSNYEYMHSPKKNCAGRKSGNSQEDGAMSIKRESERSRLFEDSNTNLNEEINKCIFYQYKCEK